MAKAPSYSVAPSDAGRSRILSWRALLGIVVLAIGALVPVFPKKYLISLLRSEAGADNRELTVAYLRNIIRTEPRDMGLRLLLVEKLMDAGDLDGARLGLTEARPLAALSVAAQDAWDRWDLMWWQARLREAMKFGREAQRNEAASELMARIERRTVTVTTAAQVFAAIQSARDLRAELGTSGGTAGGTQGTDALRVQNQLLLRLLGLPSSGTADLVRGAGMALEDARFQLASDLFFAARRKTVLPEQRYLLLQQGARALLAGGQTREAWLAAVRESKPLDAADPPRTPPGGGWPSWRWGRPSQARRRGPCATSCRSMPVLPRWPRPCLHSACKWPGQPLPPPTICQQRSRSLTPPCWRSRKTRCGWNAKPKWPSGLDWPHWRWPPGLN